MPVKLFLMAGQSNMQGRGVTVNLKNYIDGPTTSWARTYLNHWTGAPCASCDTGIQYTYPELATHPNNFAYNNTGIDTAWVDASGRYDLEYVSYSTGTYAFVGQYGPEVSFLQKYRADNPTHTLAVVKQFLGGSALNDAWLTYNRPMGNVVSSTSTTIVIPAGTYFGNSATLAGLSVCIISGAGAGQIRVIQSWDSTNNRITITTPWTTNPDSSSVFGVEKRQSRALRVMTDAMIARLNTAYGVGNYEIAGFLWMQGESGAHNKILQTNDNQYLNDFRYFRQFWRDYYNSPNMPFLIGRIGDNWGWETTPNPYLAELSMPNAAINYSLNSTVGILDGRIPWGNATEIENCRLNAVRRRATQVTLANEDPYSTWWDNDRYPILPPFWKALNDFWGSSTNVDLSAYHYSSPAYLAMGERAYTAYKNLINPAPPVDPGEGGGSGGSGGGSGGAFAGDNGLIVPGRTLIRVNGTSLKV